MKTRGSAHRLCIGLTAAAVLGGCVGTQAANAPPFASGPVELKGTDGPIYALAWAPNGGTLASAGYRQVNLWRPGADTTPRRLTGHPDLVRGVAWSPEGSSIASVGDDGIARVWSAETLVQTTTLETGPARAVKWSPDGRRLAIGSGFRLQIWHVASRALLHTARVQTQISSVSWSPDGRTVAVGGVHGMATLWTADTGALLAKMNASDERRNDVNGVAWSPHGRVLASANGARGEGEIRLWDPATASLLETVPSPAGWLRGIGWSPDAQWLAAGGEDGQVRIWNVEARQLVATLTTDSRPIWSVAWSPDGRWLAAGNTGSKSTGGTVSVWEAAVGVVRGRSAGRRARGRGDPARSRPARRSANAQVGAGAGRVQGRWCLRLGDRRRAALREPRDEPGRIRPPVHRRRPGRNAQRPLS